MACRDGGRCASAVSTKSRTRGSAIAYCSLGTKTGSQEAISQEAGAPSMKTITACAFLQTCTAQLKSPPPHHPPIVTSGFFF